MIHHKPLSKVNSLPVASLNINSQQQYRQKRLRKISDQSKNIHYENNPSFQQYPSETGGGIGGGYKHRRQTSAPIIEQDIIDQNVSSQTHRHYRLAATSSNSRTSFNPVRKSSLFHPTSPSQGSILDYENRRMSFVNSGVLSDRRSSQISHIPISEEIVKEKGGSVSRKTVICIVQNGYEMK